MKTVIFFNNKGGVEKTSLVYHLAYMYRELGFRILACDLDPQANLSSMFLSEERLEELWPDDAHQQTLLGAINPIVRGTGDIVPAWIENVDDDIGLLVGDLGLSAFEDKLSAAWPLCLNGDEAAFRTISAFARIIRNANESFKADVALIDVGPNLGAINRACMIASEYVVVPLAPDLFSLQGLRNLGPRLQDWRNEWSDRRSRFPHASAGLWLPMGEMKPAGYVVMQAAMRLDRPVKAYGRWLSRVPDQYSRSVLGCAQVPPMSVTEDPACLQILRNYRSLMPLAMEARRPMFALRPADGAMGAHQAAVRLAYGNFEDLAQSIAGSIGLLLPA